MTTEELYLWLKKYWRQDTQQTKWCNYWRDDVWPVKQ